MTSDRTQKNNPRDSLVSTCDNSHEHLLSLSEVGNRLSLSKRAVYRLIAKGDLPKPLKIGGASRLCESDLEAFFQHLKATRQ